ncbi:hypothetical protein [Desulfacinum hydrothermale]|uniref:hypothetical protein n=1 Tax=Desulfacinum hydrothermale TaxID=109258 RepID=UPI0009FF9439|nr:hypothetical protein [Desulfacinum hydrothermale]
MGQELATKPENEREKWKRQRIEAWLDAVIAYIHNNPGKAGLLSIVARKGATVFRFIFNCRAIARSFSSACQ